MESSRKAPGAASSLSGPQVASVGRLSPIRESRQDDGAAVKKVAGANSAQATPGGPTIAELGLFGLKQKKKEVCREEGDSVTDLLFLFPRTF